VQCSTAQPHSWELDRHSSVSGRAILGAVADWTHGRCPKWQKSQQCETLCSCMPQASVTDASSVHATRKHATAVVDLEASVRAMPSEADYITVLCTETIRRAWEAMAFRKLSRRKSTRARHKEELRQTSTIVSLSIEYDGACFRASMQRYLALMTAMSCKRLWYFTSTDRASRLLAPN
jgi:hypothetical protein